MTTDNAIRYLHHEAAECRGRDAGEALCLLLPALMRLMHLDPMQDVEASAFHFQFKQELFTLPFQDATDRALEARPGLAKGLLQNPVSESEGKETAPGPRRGCEHAATSPLEPAQVTS